MEPPEDITQGSKIANSIPAIVRIGLSTGSSPVSLRLRKDVANSETQKQDNGDKCRCSHE